VTAPRVSVVVVAYESRDHVLACLAAVASRVALAHEVIVVDNASTDGTVAAVRARFPAATVIANAGNAGFSRANNQGIATARGEHVLVLNGDAEVGPGCVDTLAAILDARADIGVVGPRTRFPDGRIQVSFGPPPGLLAEWRQRGLVLGVRRGDRAALAQAEALAAAEHEPGWVSGSCFLARRSALDAVGGFDEGFFLYQEDVDLCVRVRAAGWRILYTPRAEVVHHLGASMARAAGRPALEYHRSHLRLYTKHAGAVPLALLRASLLARAGLGLARAAVTGDGEVRRHAASLAGIAAGRLPNR
jgi:N-acetylglucosaminyl-diphospho-decaprenol L-rhamnosyltransferase